MKTRTKIFLSSLFIVPVLSTNLVWAHGTEVAVDNSSSNTSSQTETETETEHGTTTTTLKQRIEARKAEFKVKLQAVEKARIMAKCAGAQGIITSVQNRSASAEKARTNVYNKLSDKLSSLITKLKAANVDTTELESELSGLQAKIKTFNTDMTTYKQAVSDLKDMDCKADPDAFKASLDDARKLREQLKTDATAIRTYVKDAIKPTLQTIRQDLAAKKDTSSEGSDQ